jgi:hypothetical protein
MFKFILKLKLNYCHVIHSQFQLLFNQNIINLLKIYKEIKSYFL